MSPFLNWRYYVMTVLFTVGTISLARAFSLPDTMPDPEWDIQFLLSLIVSVVSFAAFGKLTARWSRQGKIPEY